MTTGKPWYRRTWVLVMAGLAVLVVIGMFVPKPPPAPALPHQPRAAASDDPPKRRTKRPARVGGDVEWFCRACDCPIKSRLSRCGQLGICPECGAEQVVPFPVVKD